MDRPGSQLLCYGHHPALFPTRGPIVLYSTPGYRATSARLGTPWGQLCYSLQGPCTQQQSLHRASALPSQVLLSPHTWANSPATSVNSGAGSPPIPDVHHINSVHTFLVKAGYKPGADRFTVCWGNVLWSLASFLLPWQVLIIFWRGGWVWGPQSPEKSLKTRDYRCPCAFIQGEESLVLISL